MIVGPLLVSRIQYPVLFNSSFYFPVSSFQFPVSGFQFPRFFFEVFSRGFFSFFFRFFSGFLPSSTGAATFSTRFRWASLFEWDGCRFSFGPIERWMILNDIQCNTRSFVTCRRPFSWGIQMLSSASSSPHSPPIVFPPASPPPSPPPSPPLPPQWSIGQCGAVAQTRVRCSLQPLLFLPSGQLLILKSQTSFTLRSRLHGNHRRRTTLDCCRGLWWLQESSCSSSGVNRDISLLIFFLLFFPF